MPLPCRLHGSGAGGCLCGGAHFLWKETTLTSSAAASLWRQLFYHLYKGPDPPCWQSRTFHGSFRGLELRTRRVVWISRSYSVFGELTFVSDVCVFLFFFAEASDQTRTGAEFPTFCSKDWSYVRSVIKKRCITVEQIMILTPAYSTTYITTVTVLMNLYYCMGSTVNRIFSYFEKPNSCLWIRKHSLEDFYFDIRHYDYLGDFCFKIKRLSHWSINKINVLLLRH